jgi:hypothetical protein
MMGLIYKHVIAWNAMNGPAQTLLTHHLLSGGLNLMPNSTRTQQLTVHNRKLSSLPGYARCCQALLHTIVCLLPGAAACSVVDLTCM